jgi:hypothetical protein
VLAAGLLLALTGCSDDGVAGDDSDELSATESAANLVRLQSAHDESIAIAGTVAKLLVRAGSGKVHLTGRWERCPTGEEEEPQPPTYTYRVGGWLDIPRRSPWMPSLVGAFRADGWTTSQLKDGPRVRYLYADKADARTQVSTLESIGGVRQRSAQLDLSWKPGSDVSCLRLSGDEEDQVLDWAEDPPEVIAAE